MNRSVYLLLVVTLLFALNGGPVLAQNVLPAYPEVFKLSFHGKPTTLDPQKSALLSNYNLRRHFFDPLFTLKNGEVVPVLLDSYHWKEPTCWEFVLKKRVLFHDGSELTTKDILATFRRAVRLSGVLSEAVEGYKIKVLDDYRFQVISPVADSELLWNLEDIVVIKHTAEAVDSDAFNSGEHLIGTGPYRLLGRDNFDEFRLEAFPDYHRGAAYIQQLLIRVVPDEKKRMASFLDGELDMLPYLLPRKWIDLNRTVNVTSKSSNFLMMLFLNVRRKQTQDVRGPSGELLLVNPFHDVRVRQAISKALNRDQLLLQFIDSTDKKQAAGQLINNDALLYDPILLPEKQDITAAKRLLSEAGYQDGFQVKVRGGHHRKNLIKMIAVMLEEIGIKVEVVTSSDGEFFERLYDRVLSAGVFARSSGGNLAEMLKFYQTSAKANHGGYSNLAFDQKVDDAMAQISLDLKHRKLREAHRMVMADLPVIPLIFSSNYWAIRDDMVFDPTDQNFTEAYYIKASAKTDL